LAATILCILGHGHLHHVSETESFALKLKFIWVKGCHDYLISTAD